MKIFFLVAFSFLNSCVSLTAQDSLKNYRLQKITAEPYFRLVNFRPVSSDDYHFSSLPLVLMNKNGFSEKSSHRDSSSATGIGLNFHVRSSANKKGREFIFGISREKQLSGYVTGDKWQFFSLDTLQASNGDLFYQDSVVYERYRYRVNSRMLDFNFGHLFEIPLGKARIFQAGYFISAGTSFRNLVETVYSKSVFQTIGSQHFVGPSPEPVNTAYEQVINVSDEETEKLKNGFHFSFSVPVRMFADAFFRDGAKRGCSAYLGYRFGFDYTKIPGVYNRWLSFHRLEMGFGIYFGETS